MVKDKISNCAQLLTALWLEEKTFEKKNHCLGRIGTELTNECCCYWLIPQNLRITFHHVTFDLTCRGGKLKKSARCPCLRSDPLRYLKAGDELA